MMPNRCPASAAGAPATAPRGCGLRIGPRLAPALTTQVWWQRRREAGVSAWRDGGRQRGRYLRRGDGPAFERRQAGGQRVERRGLQG